ncbi:MAG: hypothetical protein HY815_04635 [Candidatus Riflebacteria bacterium]|nr:hypothetical protein [Candidatus Riflebacteria bacterium]
MPRSHFTIEGSAALARVPAGGRIHVVGVSGVAMAQLAVELSRRGYVVSGSDKEFYDPMGSLLRATRVQLFTGYAATNAPAEVDLVVIANAMFYDNPEVQVVEQRDLPYTSFPQIVGEWLIGDRHSIVVAGTHGKTTTTGLIASVLHKAGTDPSYFIGGILDDLPDSLHVGQGRFAAVEGDEYHSAFWARVPKFVFYRSRTLVLNAIEFDHADIYPTLGDVVTAFCSLLTSLASDGVAICCTVFPQVRALLQEVGPGLSCRVVTFGTGERDDYRLVERVQRGATQIVRIESRRLGGLDVALPLMGEHNALNAMATVAALAENGFSPQLIREHLATARTVKRRQQVRLNGTGVVLIEDFAHHPTAVSVTVRAVREVYPDRKLWAVFEPRSNTSRRKVFQEEYERAFDCADQVILANVASKSRMNQDVELMGDTDVVLLMSNGSFGGLPSKLEQALRSRRSS